MVVCTGADHCCEIDFVRMLPNLRTHEYIVLKFSILILNELF